jgi:hypothetical protein
MGLRSTERARRQHQSRVQRVSGAVGIRHRTLAFDGLTWGWESWITLQKLTDMLVWTNTCGT